MQRTIGNSCIVNTDNTKAPMKATKKESATSFAYSEDEDPNKVLNKAKTNIATKQRRDEAIDKRKIGNVDIMTISSLA